MTATCGNGSGGLITDSIDLNQCIANANGQLVARAGGGFDASCSGLNFSTSNGGVTLIASCSNAGGVKVGASIDINQVVTNRSGFLTCP
ncbi:Cyanovirin-N [Mycena leptocephala]|nr:Cyanovirin-N [Mycena leptocephala]